MSLPTGYTEVQYIQSTGTQKINTDVIPTINTKLFFGINMTEITGDVIIGNFVNDDNDYRIFNYNGQTYWDIKNSRLIGAANSFPVNTYFDVECGNYYVAQNGVKIVEGTAITDFTADTSIFIFAKAINDTACAKGMLYYLKIYDGAMLIRDFIPCINPDGEAGLYDTVNSKFYGNAGTGVFLAGPRRINLPSGYAQLEYILANGAQYIDTGIAVNSQTFDKLEFECDSLYPSLTSSNYLVHGCSGSGVIFYFGLNNTNGTVVYGPGTSDQVTSYKAAANTRYHIVFSPWSKRYAFGENTPVTIATSSPSGNSNFCLFGFNNGTTCQAHPERLYSFKVRMNGALIRDYIPCMNAAGIIGLYDLVNSNFYANAGTGVFTAGPEVTWPSNDAIYVKVNGIWRQIDGIKLL